jgi:ATP-dependent DNA helicase RecG
VTVRGELVELREIRGSGPPRVQAKLADGTGWMKITWFSTWVARELREGDEIVVSGTVEAAYGPMSFTNPEWERAGMAGLSTGRLIPVYPLTEGLGQKTLRRLTRAALEANEALLTRFMLGLPFSLTDGQRQALDEILADLAQPRPMTRLLQGDVGSGKTVVAAAAGLVAVDRGAQVAVMAPTEILAEQHFHNLRGLYSLLPEAERPEVALLTGATRAAERRRVREALATNEVNVLVGTHALIQDGVGFARLALTVVDEQHRFGVRQRAELPGRGTGAQAHQLAMSATPIPRTLNMVLNGDLDVSVIAELPPGRVPIETRRYFGAEREDAYALVREQVREGRQVFVICPLVEESEAIEAKAAVAEAKRLQAEVFPELRVALIHGRLSGREKDAIMTAFRDREFDLLVATSVIEVGIDVPNATVMLIEGADRFGLAQLHQFRGRVGRGGHRSYCLLLADESTPEAEERLRTMVETSDGFVLAQKDLELRGPGDFIGTRQSGLPEMSWLDGAFDTRLLDRARQEAERLLDTDPDLSRPEHRLLKQRLQLFWEKASPDLRL